MHPGAIVVVIALFGLVLLAGSNEGLVSAAEIGFNVP